MRAFRRPWADKEISRIPQAASDNRSAGALETKGRRVLAPAWFFRAVTSSKQAWLPPLHKKTTRHSSGGLSFRGDSRIRTGDPLLAKQVLYQLSYTPEVVPGRR